MEVWKNIDNHSDYMISSYGNVKSLKKGNELVMKQSVSKKGYLNIQLHTKGKKQSFQTHRLVAIHFIENPYNKPQVNHINGIKSDNNKNNLEWNTNSENSLHAYRTGLKVYPKGVLSSTAKLSENQVYEILNNKENLTLSCLSEKYGVQKSAIYKIINRKSWTHLQYK